MGEWVDVRCRLPEKDGPCLVFVETADADRPYTGCAWYTPPGTPGCEAGWWFINSFFVPCITHWMPLPAPPKERRHAERARDG